MSGCVPPDAVNHSGHNEGQPEHHFDDETTGCEHSGTPFMTTVRAVHCFRHASRYVCGATGLDAVGGSPDPATCFEGACNGFWSRGCRGHQ